MSNLTNIGPQLWHELHLRALEFDGDKNDTAYLRRLYYRLGRDCTCRHFYKMYLESNPPDFNKYFTWTVKLHNAVNKKLGKKTLTQSAALRMWTKILKDE